MGLILGGIVFQIYEIPERIPFGGKQALALHRMVGGQRVVDAMGPDEVDPHWKGRFQGADAYQRARAVDAIRLSGAAVPLIYGPNFYTVVVEHFVGDYERVYQIPYTINCVVVDQPGAGFGGFNFGIDAVVGADLVNVGSLLTSFLGNIG